MRGLLATMLGRSEPRATGSGDPIVVGASPFDDFWYSQPGRTTTSGVYVTPDTAMQVAAVYGCVSVLAKMVATIPLRMYRKTGTSSAEAPNHPINDLLEYQPNSWQTAWDFKAFLMMSLALRGNGYAQIFPGPRGAVDRLEPIHPDRVQVQRMPDGSIRYQLSNNGPTTYLLQDEMLHLRSHIAPGGIVGVGPISYARQTIGLAQAAEEHGARIFSGGARPQGVVTVPAGLSDEAFNRFKAEWNAMNVGLNGAGRTPILEAGATFAPITMDNVETQFIQSRQFAIEEICRWFDVPPVMLHHMTNTTSWGTGVEAIMLAFVRNNLMPWLKCWTDAIRRDLILAPGVFEARFDVESLQRGDSTAVANYLSKLVPVGVLTRNEGREMLGYNPIDGLDEPLIMLTTSTVTQAPDHSAPDPDAGGTDDPTDGDARPQSDPGQPTNQDDLENE